jgi:acetolactate synthase-1/3 small subunit
MSTRSPETQTTNGHSTNGNGQCKRPAVLEITVSNHPGVMSHVCGLFARRAYNLEGIICLPVADGAQSRIWLLMNEDQRLEQITKQLMKLEDVNDVRRHGADHEVFVGLEEFFRE